MDRFSRTARRGAVVAVAMVSVAVGALLVWTVVRPEVVGTVRTGELVMLLGLSVLPGCALAGWAIDRRIRRNDTGAARAAAAIQPERDTTPDRP